MTLPTFTTVTKYRQESVNGVHVSVLKSALQKAIRRKDIALGYISLGYLSAFDDSTMEGMRLRSTITNRFVACMSEEVSINEFELPSQMEKLYKSWKNNRADPVESTNLWIQMFELLSSSRKCRVVSDVKSRYNLPPYKSYKKRLGILDKMHDELLLHHGIRDPDTQDINNVKKAVEHFKASLLKKSYHCFVYLRSILRIGKPSDIKGIFDFIKNCARNNRMKEQILSLKFFYTNMTHDEKPIYLYHAVLLILEVSKREVPEDLRDLSSSSSSVANYDSVISAASQHDGIFPDYVLDIHTTSNVGGKTSLDFAVEGAAIVDEDRTYLNEKYRQMYIDFKKLQNKQYGAVVKK